MRLWLFSYCHFLQGKPQLGQSRSHQTYPVCTPACMPSIPSRPRDPHSPRQYRLLILGWKQSLFRGTSPASFHHGPFLFPSSPSLLLPTWSQHRQHRWQVAPLRMHLSGCEPSLSARSLWHPLLLVPAGGSLTTAWSGFQERSPPHSTWSEASLESPNSRVLTCEPDKKQTRGKIHFPPWESLSS